MPVATPPETGIPRAVTRVSSPEDSPSTRRRVSGRVAPSPVTHLHSQGRPVPSWCSSPPVVHSEHFFSTFCPFCRRRQLQLPFLPPPTLQFFFSRFSSSSVGLSSSSVVFSTVWVPFFFIFKLHSRDSPSY